MDKKIVFFDVDGTIFNNRTKKIPKSTIESIKNLKEKGVITAIATGRSVLMLSPLLDDIIPHIDAFVAINGQHVIFKNNVIYDNPLDKDMVEAILNRCDELDIDYVLMSDNKYTASSHCNEVKEIIDLMDLPLPEINKKLYLNNSIYQILVCGHKRIHIIENEYKNILFTKWWTNNGADICPKDGTKAVGIKKLCERLDIDINDAYAIGDANNDIDMISTVGNGIAMGNATDELKAVADYITTTIDENGVYNALKHFNLI